MSDFVNKGHSRRTFLKFADVSAAAATVGFPAFAGGESACNFGLAVPVNTFFGQAAEKAARLAAAQINANGGFLGTDLEVLVEDSGGSANQASLAVQALASRGSDFQGGIFFSEELVGLLPSFGIIRQIFWGTGASTPDASVSVELDYANNKFFFRTGPANSLFILEASVKFVIGLLEQTLGWEKIVLFAEDAAWNTAITDLFGVLLAANGSSLEVADIIRYPEATTDFGPFFSQAEQAIGNSVGGIFSLMAHTGVTPTAQWASRPDRLPLYGINVQAQDSRFDELTNGAAESVVTFTSAARTPLTAQTVQFVDDFAAFTDVNPDITIPSYNAFHTYDALLLMQAAVNATGVLPNSEANNDSLIQELESYDGEKTFPGTTGNLAFFQRGETGVSALRPDLSFPHDVRFGGQFGEGVWIQWQGGEQEVVFPPVATDGQTNIITAPIIGP